MTKIHSVELHHSWSFF